MITTVVFSKDRACQLDLLLRTIGKNAPIFEKDLHILWSGSTEEYRRSYEVCVAQHPKISFVEENSFQTQVLRLLQNARDFVMFLCDDSVFYRPFTHGRAQMPYSILSIRDDVICVSLRLGEHTTECYPMRAAQQVPEFLKVREIRVWKWRGAQYDFGYPGSLDGHIFRKHHARALLLTGTFDNPNQMEDVLNRACHKSALASMACYQRSVLVNLPVNRVNSTHGNRFGETYPLSEEALNDRYLIGGRLSFENMRIGYVKAAHQEEKLVFIGG